MKLRISMTGFGVILFLLPRFASAWGNYGHEQIQSAAIDLLASHGSPLARCWQASPAAKKALLRYAVTPDYDWKLVGPTPSDPALKAKKTAADRYEHPLHFFEVDAFTGPLSGDFSAIQALPSSQYRVAFPSYAALLNRNAAYVAEVDPTKALVNPASPTVAEVTGHGTAPWRARQLYVLGVQALKAKDVALATLYLGAMGHYIGDLSQPFHSSMNYDGKYPVGAPTNGIHSAFESEMLQDVATAAGASRDRDNVWSSFEATRAGVDAEAKALYAATQSRPIGSEALVGELMGQLAGIFPSKDALLQAFGKACAELSSLDGKTYCQEPEDDDSHHGHPKGPDVPSSVIRKFRDSSLPRGAQGSLTVLQGSELLMGAASALLARAWEAAYRDAGQPALAPGACGSLAFDPAYAINHYPIPDYLP